MFAPFNEFLSLNLRVGLLFTFSFTFIADRSFRMIYRNQSFQYRSNTAREVAQKAINYPGAPCDEFSQPKPMILSLF